MGRWATCLAVVLLTVLSLFGVMPAEARDVHYFNCVDCHRSGSAITGVVDNLCLNCHDSGAPGQTSFNDGSTGNLPTRYLTGDDASNVRGRNVGAVNQTSHIWGTTTDVDAGAGAAAPSAAVFYGSYNASRGKVTCSRCHDPHGTLDLADATNLKMDNSNDQMCRDCHAQWTVSNVEAMLTHPIVSDYAAIATADPTKYNATPANVGNGDVRLVNDGTADGVSCTTCHGTHFTDSDSSTTDGYGQVLSSSDGYILRTDGPTRTGDPRDTVVTGTAQLRSNLCQSCHLYAMHGKGGNNQMIGCLDCHGGHSYNGGAPNAYILATDSPDAVPVRALRAANGTASVTYFDSNLPNYPAGADTRLVWADDVEGTAYGFCERCHGDVQDTGAGGLGNIDVQHQAGAINQCDSCHIHSDPTYSFANDANAATCGACHGFPPFKNISGYRASIGDANDGGYADNQDDAPTYDYLNDTSYFKDETQTAHTTHAGAALAGNPGEWYFVGDSGIANCKPCHGDSAGTVAGNHRQDPATYPETFRDLPFDAVATGGGALVSSYDTGAFTCNNIYCHTNGAPYDDAGAGRPNRDYTTVHVTPPWVGNGSNYAAGGYGSIFLQPAATRCSDCHGNDSATMTTQSNSPAHNAHLDAGFSCDVCHNDVAVDGTTLVAGATDGKNGGKHVNTEIDVVFPSDTGGSNLLYDALAVNGVGVDYDVATGTCANYCHDPADSGMSADWDSAVALACDSCHGGLASDGTPITTGSHGRHIRTDLNGPQLACTECHSNSGSGADHINGVVDVIGPVDTGNFTSICEECHGYDGEIDEVLPVWGSPATTDCATCHAGNFCGSSFNSMSPLFVQWARQGGHNRPTASGAYPESANPAANADCSDCHLTDSANHWDGTDYATSGLEADLMLRSDNGFPATYAGNEDSYCNNCHGTSGVRLHPTLAATQANTQDVYTHQTKKCVACHNVHGDQNIQMIWRASIDQQSHDPSGTGMYSGSLVWFTNLTDFGTDSYDEDDGAVGGAGEDNADDICAVCHSTTGGTAHNNSNNSVIDHNQGTDCFTCHNTHGDPGGAFSPGAGTACNDCHGNPPSASDARPADAVGAHEAHTYVASHDPALEDKFDCGVCHQGGETFALDGAHSTAPLVVGIGYNAGDGTCSGACHLSTVGDGYWTDPDGLNCDSCHYWDDPPAGTTGNDLHGKPLTGTHSKHFDANKACTDCHADNSADAGSHPEKRAHIDDHDTWDLNLTNDGTVLADRGAATQDEATVVVTTWDDGLNTCANAACHNPTGAANFVEWGVTAGSSCDLCHMSNPTTGSHQQHLAASVVTTFGKTIVCADCHTSDNSGNYAHLDGTVGLNGFTYSASLTEFTGASFGQCTTTTCHNDGKGSAQLTPVWGRAPSAVDDCTNCHSAPPATGRHAQHVANTNYVTDCGECHLNATSSTITETTHINGTVQAGNAAINLVSTDGVTCTNACHDVDATGTWTDANTLDCTECHTAGKIGTAPASGLHTGTLTISGNTHDVSFEATRGEGVPSGTCTTCHTGIDLASDTPVAHAAGGAPDATQAAIDANLNYTYGAPSTCSPGGGLAGCHDDAGAWSRQWSSSAQNSDNTECANCHGTFDQGWTSGVIVRHAGDAQVEAGHTGIAGEKCYMCHTFKEGQTVPYDFSVKHRDGTIQLNNDMLFTDNDADINTCNGCHDSGAGPYGTADGEYGFIDTNKDDTADGGVDRWSRELVAGGPSGNCNGCHVLGGRDHSGANESATVHTAHTGSPMSPGCGGCHPADSGPGGANHDNGTVDFGGTYLTTTLNYTGADFTNTNCSSANGCHDTDAGSWAADSLSTCAMCHDATGKILDQGGYPPSSNEHTAHLGNSFYVGTVGVDACDACHGAGSSVSNALAAHNDGTVTVTNDITAYTLLASAGDGTCTNNCHTVVSGRDWDSATTLNCADCHAAGKLQAYLSAWPVASAKHTAHIDNDTYVTNDCADCHGASADTGAHVSHKDGTVDNTLSYVSVSQTCTNSCHIADTTGDWTPGGALVCVDCHKSGKSIDVAPSSGLHNITTTITNTTHDESLQSGDCVNCHDSSSPTSLHKDGTTQNSGSATFTFNGANVSAYASGTGCNASCHSDFGGWARQWSTTAANSDGSECGNCHGTFTTGFTSGVVARHETTGSGDADGDVAGNHDGTDPCYLCHTYKSGDTTYYDFSVDHRDDNIQINSQISFTDNGSTVGCSACHVANDGTADEGHEFDETTLWTRQQIAGPSANCNDCHTTNSRTHSGVNESSVLHDLHTTSSLYGGGCAACHPHTGPGDAKHNDGNVDFGGTYLTAALDYTGADFANTNCSSANGCHDSDAGEWAAESLGGDSCTDCHAATGKFLSQNDMFPPTGNKHTIHIDQDTYVPGDCADCHGVSADTGAHSGHRNGSIDDIVTYSAGNATCDSSCHWANTNDDWTIGSLVCADCHSSGKSLDAGGEADFSTTIGPDAGEHDVHMANATYVGGGCADCHGHSGALGAVDGHLDGPDTATITVATNISGYNTSLATCTNSCHNVVDGNDWLSGTGLNCADCHAAGGLQAYLNAWPVASAKHTKHIDNDTYVSGDCTDCHGTDAATGAHAGHKNGSVENTVTYVSGTQTCTNSCHVADTATDWTPGGALACLDCHKSGKSIDVAPTSGLHNITPTVSATTHDETLAAGDCINCHDSASPTSLHKDGTTQNSSGATFTFHANVSAYASGTGCNASCHQDGGDWARQWSTNAASSDGTECLGCHGGIGLGYAVTTWNSGIVPDHTANWDGDGSPSEVTANHAVCKTCHGYNGDADMDVNYVPATMHRNNQITLNSGTAYNDADWGCDSAGCHGAAASGHALADSGLTYEGVSFDAASSCDGCHGSGGYYAPDGTRTPGVYPDRPGLHLEHTTAMEAKGITHADTCGYCHPDPGGAGHSTLAEPVDMPDNSTWWFKRIVGGGDDANGVFNSGTNSCSNIDCHFNNPVTPHWYADTNAPEAVTLALAAGAHPGSITVSWSAPGDDDSLDDTIAYAYDLRFGESQAIAENYGLTDNIAGGLPAAYKRGEPAEVTISGLDPAKTYWFSLKTQDTAGNWSNPSTNTPSLSPPADTEAPMFYGADKATPGDEGASINLWWTAAEDHTMYNFTTLAQTPITYDVWVKSELDGNLDMDVDSAAVTGFAGVGIELSGTYGATTITNDITYQLGVRACDALANCDTNTIIVKATPKSVSDPDKTFHTYVSSGTTSLAKDGSPGGGATTTAFQNTGDLIFTGASQAYDVLYFVDAFVVTLDPGNTVATVSAELGTWNGSSFTGSGKIKQVSPAKRTIKAYTFKFSDGTGVSVAGGDSIAIQLTSSASVDAQYGTAATRGDASLSERIVNALPNVVVAPSVALNGAIVDMSWTVPAGDTDGLDNVTDDPIHYDIYGSDDDGATWDYVIAEELDGTATSYSWDTQADGIISGTIAVKISVGDGFGHSETIFNSLGTADNLDDVAPAAVTDLTALARPKSGSVVLRWTSPGDDEWNNGRAHHFDVRWSTSDITSDALYNSATLLDGEPSPDFGKHMQEFEVTGLPAHDPAAPVTYYFAIKVVDEAGNTSALSNSASSYSGPRCGMCHSTAPSVVSSVGNHKLHGFTLQDCAKCHGAASATYGLDHQDGSLTMGYGPGGPVEGVISTTTVADDTITYTDPNTLEVMYQDTNGYGGFGQWGVNGELAYIPVDDGSDNGGTDNGSCFSFGAMGVAGCHGPAGSDPDDAATLYPTFETPDWSSTANLDCGRCHGNPNRDESVGAGYLKDPYGHDYDGTTDNAGVVPDQIIGAPGADNRGGWDYNDVAVDSRKYIGQHEKHLNYSFRFSKGDSCNLCHAGHYSDINDLDARHGDGYVDVELDLNAAGADAVYTPGGAGVAGTCATMDPDSCHPYDATPSWDSTDSFDCIGCHTMGGEILGDDNGGTGAWVGHIIDTDGGVTLDNDGTNTLDGGPMLGNCTWCHFAGHPRDDVGGTALILPNNSQVGINYRSGGIHLRKDPGNLGTSYNTQAELCWGCHDRNGISEWGTDDGTANSTTVPDNNSDYDYGSVTTSDWTTAQWSSSNFGYKTGNIQSTHSTNIMYGSAAVTWNGADGQWEESPDAVGNLQCHNCHDVHNMNFAIGDTMDGNPYLRGTWIRNPYPEDGAPLTTSTFAAENKFMEVPRGGTMYNNLGGYQIDQNNIDATSGLPPTAGLGLGNSAGLCTLCHGTDVDNLDYTPSENLWIGTNGHSNSALGGTADDLIAADIMSFAERNPNETPTTYTADYSNGGNPMMGYVNATTTGAADMRGDGFRSAYSGKGYGITPVVDGGYYAYVDFTWGVTQDTGTIDKAYHAFSCSKCHNPHASRLPKLMITNCLDTRHNTWDDSKTITGDASQGDTTSVDNANQELSNGGSAQNCHRLGDSSTGGTGSGWNVVTPWTVAP